MKSSEICEQLHVCTCTSSIPAALLRPSWQASSLAVLLVVQLEYEGFPSFSTTVISGFSVVLITSVIYRMRRVITLAATYLTETESLSQFFSGFFAVLFCLSKAVH